jgi:hypothetical protein
MSRSLLQVALAAALLTPLAAFPASDAEIAELRALVDQMKSQYERRIQDLESRLAKAERASTQAASRLEAAAVRAEQAAQVAAAESRPMTAPQMIPASAAEPSKRGFGALDSGTAFNPQISVILDGNYYHDTIEGEGGSLVGRAFQPSGGAAHSHGHGDDHDDGGHSHGAPDNGFNFRTAEIAFSGTVDPYFDATLYLAVDGDGNVELEEGYFQTRGLPAGVRVKGGKFLSDFGYINKQHPHQWDFVDQNLPYLNLLGDHGLQDTGSRSPGSRSSPSTHCSVSRRFRAIRRSSARRWAKATKRHSASVAPMTARVSGPPSPRSRPSWEPITPFKSACPMRTAPNIRRCMSIPTARGMVTTTMRITSWRCTATAWPAMPIYGVSTWSTNTTAAVLTDTRTFGFRPSIFVRSRI